MADYNSWMKANYYSKIFDANVESAWRDIHYKTREDQNNSVSINVRSCAKSDCSDGNWSENISGLAGKGASIILVEATAFSAAEAETGDQIDTLDSIINYAGQYRNMYVYWLTGNFAGQMFKIYVSSNSGWNALDYLGLTGFEVTEGLGDMVVSGWKFQIVATYPFNRYFQYKVNFDTNSELWNVYRQNDFGLGEYAKFSDANIVYNRLPDTNVARIEGLDAQQALKFFSYVRDANLTIDFNVLDWDSFDLHKADINYSSSVSQATGTILSNNFLADGNHCKTNFINGYNFSETDTNLIAYYSFDDDNGTNIFDKSNNGNIAHFVGKADNNAQGKWDTNALYLGGQGDAPVGDYVNVPSPSFSFDDNSTYTWIAWIKMDEHAGAGWNAQTIVAQRSAGGGNGYSLHLQNYGSGDYNIILDGDLQAESKILLSVDKWYHIAATYNNETVQFFVNGIKDISDNTVGLFDPQAGEFNVGRKHSVDEAGDFWGIIEEVKVFDKVLSQKEIEMDYNYGLTNKRTCTLDWNINSTLVADGNYFINLLAKDSNGATDFNSSYTIGIDNTPPTKTLVTPDGNQTTTTPTPTSTINVSDRGNNTIICDYNYFVNDVLTETGEMLVSDGVCNHTPATGITGTEIIIWHWNAFDDVNNIGTRLVSGTFNLSVSGGRIPGGGGRPSPEPDQNIPTEPDVNFAVLPTRIFQILPCWSFDNCIYEGSIVANKLIASCQSNTFECKFIGEKTLQINKTFFGNFLYWNAIDEITIINHDNMQIIVPIQVLAINLFYTIFGIPLIILLAILFLIIILSLLFKKGEKNV